MRLMLGPVLAVFILGIGSAYAGDGDGQSATTLFTTIQNQQAAHARTAVQTPTVAAQNNNGAAVQAHDARSHGQGMWLFRVFSLP